MSAQVVICDGCSTVLAQGTSIGVARRDVTDMGGKSRGNRDVCPYCLERGETA